METKRASRSQENRRQRMLGAASDDERLSIYCEAVLADPHVTMLQILDMHRPLDVARVYVPLCLSEERQRGDDTPVFDEESTETPDVWIEEERQRRERHVEVIYDPEKAISTFPRCVIVGGPGAGKTTLLLHLTIMAAQRSISGMPSLLPVYVELQSFVRSGFHDLLDFVSATWEEAYAFPAQQARLLLANYLDEGKALLLLDALDEAVVGEMPEAAEQSYEAVSQAILSLATDYPKTSMVVTIRKASYRQHKPLIGFTTLEVMGFDFEDVKQFVQNWYNDSTTDEINRAPTEKSTDLIRHLDANPRLQTLAANPCLLMLIVLAYEDRLGLPESRAELYRTCIETWLTKWDARSGIRSRWELKPEQKHQLLKVIAWHFHQKKQRYFTEHDLLQVIAEFLPTINLPAERNKDILQEIESEQGVLKEFAPLARKQQATGWHGFLHLTLQEYFAAEYINDHGEYAELLRHRADSWWEEVLLLCMGITPDASLFLQELCSQNSTIREDIFYTNLLLAGRCLGARPKVREAGLRAQIIDRLFELLISTQYSTLRQEVIKVLCGIGVFETNTRLVTLLSDERLNTFIRWDIAEALGRLGERSVAGDLVQLLSDEQLNVFIRWTIADALGRLGERSVARDLVQLLSDERINVLIRWNIAEALGRLGERSVARGLVQLLADDQQDVDLRRRIAEALGTLGERSVAGDLVQLLFDERLGVDLRRSITDALGTLGERSVAGDLVQLLADDQQDVNVRRSIADALSTLGEWPVAASALVQLLADDEQDMFVRRRITGALGMLGERSVARDLVQLLADERLNADLRLSIAEALGMLGERSVAGDLVRLLADDQQDVNVRRAIAGALGRLGERLMAARAMVQLLSDDQLDTFARWSIADGLGRLGERSVARDLVRLLSDDQLDADLRVSIADALGRLGERSITGDLVQLLADEQQDVNVRRAIAGALSRLGERPVAARAMVQLLSSDRFGMFAQRSIASALGALGERSVAGDLVRLLSDERLNAFVRRKIADGLGRLGERSVAGDLVQLLADERLDADLRKSIAGALEAYADDISILEGLIKSQIETNSLTHAMHAPRELKGRQDKEISDSVYNALWTISRRVRVWIFPLHLTAHSESQAHYEIVPWV